MPYSQKYVTNHKKIVAFLDKIWYSNNARGSDSVVECHLAKVKVAGPNPVSRSTCYGSAVANLYLVSDEDRKLRICRKDMHP